MDMTTERPTAVHALHDGDRAYFTTEHGLVSCQLDRWTSPGRVFALVAENRFHYRRLDEVMVPLDALVHPDAIHGHHFAGGPRILGRTVYMGER